MNHIETLNAITEGWTQSPSGGMMVNHNNLDIIDICRPTGKWFYISGMGNAEGFASKDDAVKAYVFMCVATNFIKVHQDKLIAQGFTPGISWIDTARQMAYVSCKESTPGTYGGATKEAIYSHENGIVSGNI